MKSAACYDIFCECIGLYHELDDVDGRLYCVHARGSFEETLFRKCEIDTVQWHLEDLIRDPSIEPLKALLIKRRIDHLNQRRTDTVELIDDYFLHLFSNRPSTPGARHNTESIGWAIDRLSILALKIYHMDIELARDAAPEGHRINCAGRRAVLQRQLEDLLQSIDWLIEDISSGVLQLKVYRQMKMYNDKDFNPVLYKRHEPQIHP